MRQLDTVFVNYSVAERIYQGLANKFSAIEPPTWSLLLAQACRAKGFRVAILDADAEGLTKEQTYERIKYLNPRFVTLVTYGQNPNSGTTNMAGTYELARYIKEVSDYPICSIGSHTSALPHEVLAEPFIDFVCINEGVKTLQNLICSDLKQYLSTIPGLGYKKDGKCIVNNGGGTLIKQEEMDTELPGYAWDLLDVPLSEYRAHVWHPNYDESKRSPFAAIYTSLGCRFACSFCMINILNREDESLGIHAGNSSTMRYWSPNLVLKWFEELAAKGVETIRISDEMFYLNKKYYGPILAGIVERGLKICTWTYSRVDTVNERFLELFQKAGVNWLGIGIEAANQTIRADITKGRFKDIDIRDVVKQIENAGINVGANYIFGFPNEKKEDMQATLDLAIELNTAFANFYTCTNLPGSPLYYEAKANGWVPPRDFEGYGFLSYYYEPSPTKHLTGAEVLQFRDDAWNSYFTRPEYLGIIEKKFGVGPRKNVEELAKIQLKRKVLGH